MSNPSHSLETQALKARIITEIAKQVSEFDASATRGRRSSAGAARVERKLVHALTHWYRFHAIHVVKAKLSSCISTEGFIIPWETKDKSAVGLLCQPNGEVHIQAPMWGEALRTGRSRRSLKSVTAMVLVATNRSLIHAAIAALPEALAGRSDCEAILSAVDKLGDYMMNGADQHQFCKHPRSPRFLSSLNGKSELLATLKLLWTRKVFCTSSYSRAIKVFGFNPSLAEYNWAARNKALLSQFENEAPNLMSLLSLGSSGKLYECCATSAIDRVGDQALAEVKRNFRARGLTEQAWKWLCKQKAENVRRLVERCVGYVPIQSYQRPGTGFGHLNLWASRGIGVLPVLSKDVLDELLDDPLSHFGMEDFDACKAYHLRVEDIESAIDLSPAKTKRSARDLTRTLVRRARRTVAGVAFLHQLAGRKVRVADRVLLIAVRDYMCRVAGTNLMRNISWKALMAAQERYHRTVWQEQYANTDQKYREWTPLLGSFADKVAKTSFSATELVNSDQLREEGFYMQHCVGGYAEPCHAGRSFVFSIRQNGKRVSTLELTPGHGGRLVVRQNQGACKARVSAAVKKFGDLVATAAIKKMNQQKKAKIGAQSSVGSSDRDLLAA